MSQTDPIGNEAVPPIGLPDTRLRTRPAGVAGAASPDSGPRPTIVAAAVGNSRIRLARFDSGELHAPVSIAKGDHAGLRAALTEHRAGGAAPLMYSSVNSDQEADLLAAAGDRFEGVYRVGRDLAIPITHNLINEATVGHDRLLCAAAAYARAESACVVIDAGTAVTVDFVDGEGGFQGGAIAPGLAMMLRSLHEGTGQLPLLEPGATEHPGTPWGRHTSDAMQTGVRAAVIGMTRYLLEQYADAFGAYPRVIATGGDAAALFDGDELIEHIIPDLQLMGIELACREALDGEAE